MKQGERHTPQSSPAMAAGEVWRRIQNPTPEERAARDEEYDQLALDGRLDEIPPEHRTMGRILDDATDYSMLNLSLTG